MGMPSSGSLGLRACQACLCSSISCGVCGTLEASTSLLSMGVSAGKTADHGMLEFYNFCRETSYKSIGFSNISRVGTNGVSSTVCSLDCICSNGAMVAGQCYTITLCHFLCSNNCTGSRACVQLCGTAINYCCVITNGAPGVSFSCSFVVDQADTVCMINLALHGVVGGTPVSCARTCITSVAATEGLFCKTAGVSDCTVWSS